MANQDAVWVGLFLGSPGKQLGTRVDAEILLLRHSRVEGLEASSLRSLLLTKFVWSVAKHDALVISDASLRVVTACRILHFIL